MGDDVRSCSGPSVHTSAHSSVQNEFEQIDKIFKMFGTPTEETWPGLTKLHYYQMVQTQCGTKPQPNRFNEHFGMCARAPPAPARVSRNPPPSCFAPTRPPASRPLARQLTPLTSTPTRLPLQAQSLLQRLLAMDPSKRINAADALDHDYFWEEPYPSRPEDLPKYAQSHEFTAKKRRQDQAKGAPAPAPAQPAHQQVPHQRPAYQQQPANGAYSRGAPHNSGSYQSSYHKRPREGYDNGGGYAADRRPRLAGG